MKKLLYFLFLLLVTCKPTQPKDSINTVEPENNSEEQIAFYFFQASKGLDNTIQIKHQKQQLVQGKLKGFFYAEIPADEYETNNLLVTFQEDSDQKIQLQIVNPLVEIVEYVNVEGQFEKKTIYHETKDFVMRIPYNNPIKSVTFELLGIVDQKLKPLFVSKLDLN